LCDGDIVGSLKISNMNAELEQIKDSHAKLSGYEDWTTFINDQPNYMVEKIMDTIAENYANFKFRQINKRIQKIESKNLRRT
jgi:hypothetical protein